MEILSNSRAYVNSGLFIESQVLDFLNRLKSNSYCYILKSVKEIQFKDDLEAQSLKQLSPEGQFFTEDTEIRWKKAGDRYQVLSLSTCDLGLEGFQPLEGDWIYKDRKTVPYTETETRIPKPINLKGVNIGQRYFIDRRTETIHFIALRRVLKP